MIKAQQFYTDSQRDNEPPTNNFQRRLWIRHWSDKWLSQWCKLLNATMHFK